MAHLEAKLQKFEGARASEAYSIAPAAMEAAAKKTMESPKVAIKDDIWAVRAEGAAPMATAASNSRILAVERRREKTSMSVVTLASGGVRAKARTANEAMIAGLSGNSSTGAMMAAE